MHLLQCTYPHAETPPHLWFQVEFIPLGSISHCNRLKKIFLTWLLLSNPEIFALTSYMFEN